MDVKLPINLLLEIRYDCYTYQRMALLARLFHYIVRCIRVWRTSAKTPVDRCSLIYLLHCYCEFG